MGNRIHHFETHEGRTDAHPELFGKFAVWAILVMLILVVAYLAGPRAIQARSSGGAHPAANVPVRSSR